MACYDCGAPATSRRCKDGSYRCSDCIAKRAAKVRAAATQSWRSRHHENVRQHRRNYYTSHWREQYLQGYEQRLVRAQGRRAMHVAALCNEHTLCKKIDRRSLWGRDEGQCRIKLACDGIFVPFEEMHLDHIVPLSRGGLHCLRNVQTSCSACNLAKGNAILERVW